MGNWEYEAFSGFGQGLATGLTERRKRQDKEEEERQKRLIALLQGKAASGVKDLDGYDDLKDMAQADPSQLPTLINTAQERRKSGAAQADQDDARSQFLRTMGVGTEYGPTSPDVETKADVYSKSAQASRPTIIDKAMQEKSQPFVGDVAKTFGLDPMKLQMRTQGGMTTSQAVDAELADRRKGEKDDDPVTKKWLNDIEIRRRARGLIDSGKNDEAETLLQDYGLSLTDSGVVSEKALRERYSRYANSEKSKRTTPGLDILMSTGAFGKPPEMIPQIVNERLGPVKSWSDWLESPEALQLNPELADKLRGEEQTRLNTILSDWQLAKVDTSPDEFIEMIKKSSDYGKHLDEYTIAQLRNMLR